ncbi:MAG: flagellar motor switch protein FliM [Deltaproteobacteria bacterium]|nr:flagellar motor switch protein FliM [Deltaproteobacteria bacterium]
MEQILTQEEIDALLKGLSEGEIPVAEETEPKKQEVKEVRQQEVKRFDFLRHTRVRKEHFPALQFIFDRFSKSFQHSLSVFIEEEVEVELRPLQYMRYDEFVKNLPLPTNMNVLVTDNLKGFFITIFDAKMVFAILEVMFGAKDVTTPKVEGREFTKIELGVIKKVLELVAAEMEKAWEPVYRITCRYSRSEMNPAYITLISPDETVCMCELSVSVANVPGWMKICIPYTILETIKEYLLTTPSREDIEMRRKWFDKLFDRVKDVPVQARVILAKKRMTLKDFMDLKPGSLFFVDRYVDDPVEIEIEKKAKFTGRIGTYKGVKAIKIERILRA